MHLIQLQVQYLYGYISQVTGTIGQNGMSWSFMIVSLYTSRLEEFIELKNDLIELQKQIYQ